MIGGIPLLISYAFKLHNMLLRCLADFFNFSSISFFSTHNTSFCRLNPTLFSLHDGKAGILTA